MRKVGKVAVVIIFLLVGSVAVGQVVTTQGMINDLSQRTGDIEDAQESNSTAFTDISDRFDGVELGGGKAHDMQARQVGNRGIEGVITLHFLTAEGKYPTPEQVDSIVDKLVVRNMKSKAFWANVRASAPSDWTWLEKPGGVTPEEFAEYKKAKGDEIAELKEQIEILKSSHSVTAEEFAEYKKAKGDEIAELKGELKKVTKDMAQLVAITERLVGVVEGHQKLLAELPNEEFVRGVVRVNADALRGDMAENVDSLTSLVAVLSGQVDGIAKATLLSMFYNKRVDSIDTLEGMYGKDWIREVLAETKKTSSKAEE